MKINYSFLNDKTLIEFNISLKQYKKYYKRKRIKMIIFYLF